MVNNSDYAREGSINGSTGTTITVTCDIGYVHGGETICDRYGSFSTVSCKGLQIHIYLNNHIEHHIYVVDLMISH